MSRIEVACDTQECDEFVQWLNANGHDAKVGASTGSYVDGVWTSTDEDADELMRSLWTDYCASAKE